MTPPTALPRLTGRWLAPYRMFGCVPALAGLFATTGVVARRPEAEGAGLRLNMRDPDLPLRLALTAGGGMGAGGLLPRPRPDGKEQREALGALKRQLRSLS